MAEAYSYNPIDWYWKAQDGRLFSSAKPSTVSPANAGFVARSENGRAPTAWPCDDAGAQTDAALQEVLAPYGISVTSPPAGPQSVTQAQAKIALHPPDIDYERPPQGLGTHVITFRVWIPDNFVPGPAIYRATPQYACNPLQRYYRPITRPDTVIEFDIVDRQQCTVP
jgi:hypothetical protein